MSDRILVDTNIILDMAIQGRPEHAEAIELAHMIDDEKIKVYICALTLKDVYYVLTKHMGESDACTFVTAAMDTFAVCPVDLLTCRQAVESDETDFKDGIIRICAEREHVDYLISRDTSAFTHSHIKRVSAKEYVNLSV